MIAGHTFEIRHRFRLFGSFSSSFSEWHFQWPLQGEVDLRIPHFVPSPKWNIMLAGDVICWGEHRQSFLPSRNNGIYWHYQEETLFDRGMRRMRMHHALYNQAGRVVACWNPVCYGARGVIRSSLSTDAISAVFGIMAISVLMSQG